MKPILEWYEQLPEPIRSQAIANCSSYYRERDCLHRAIGAGMIWCRTPEGFQYWSDVYDKAERGEFNKPDIAQSLNQLEATLNEVKQALEEVRKAIKNEKI